MRFAQHSVTNGEIAEDLHGRFDWSQHDISLAKAYNVIIHPEGGVSNRGGLRMVQQVKDSSAEGMRLIPFEYNTEQQYVLEFGDEYVRVIRDGSYVYETAKTITGATAADPCVVTTSGAHGYSNGDEVFISEIVGMTELNNRSFLVASVTSTTFELQDLEGNDVDSSGYTAYSSAGSVEKVYEIVSPYALADLKLDPDDQTKAGIKHTQSADVMTITHRDYLIRELTRSAHDSWAFSLKSIEPEQAAPTGVNISSSSSGSDTMAFKVTAVNKDTGEESYAGRATTTYTISAATKANPCVITVTSTPNCDVGDEIEIDSVVGMTELNGGRYVVGGVSGSDITLRDVDSTNFTTYSSAGTVHTTYAEDATIDRSAAVTISWTAAADAREYNVYQRVNGLFGYVGSVQGTSLTITNLDGDETDAPPSYRNPFDGDGNSPQTTSYYEQRQAFGGSTNKPQGFELSQSANFDNFSFSTPRRDSDAISRVIASRSVNEVRHFVPLEQLLVLTSGSCWAVRAGEGEVITPTSIVVRPQQGRHGSSHVRPVITSEGMLYVLKDGRSIRNMEYNITRNGYGGDNLTIFSHHLFDRYRLVAMDFSDGEESLLVTVRSDGLFPMLTYMPEQEVSGWSLGETRGEVEDVCVIEENNARMVYMLVKRRINGTTKRFIERMEERDFFHDHDQFFVDCGLTYDEPVTITGFTKADPCVVTTSGAHGFSNGDVVDISGVKVYPVTGTDLQLSPYEYDEINKTSFTVANVTSTTFELTVEGDDVDSTSWRTYASGGEVRKQVTSVGGFRHLAGESVVALANGDVVSGLTVAADGTVELPFGASRVHVGLPYYSEIETLDINFADENGEVDSKWKRIGKVFLRVRKTRGIKATGNRDRIVEVAQSVDMTTGLLGVSVPTKYDRAGRVTVRQDNPLGMTILSIIRQPEIESDDTNTPRRGRQSRR